MDRSGAASRASNRRQPLSDAGLRANAQVRTPKRASPGAAKQSIPPFANSSDLHLPHHESVVANGQLTIRNATSSPENKRLSAISSDVAEDSKRNSQVSTTSTNASSKGRKRKTHIGPWQLGGDLGKGGCGKVRKCRHALTGQEAAVKIIEKKVADYARAESLMSLAEAAKKPGGLMGTSDLRALPFGVEREVVIMKLLDHPNVVKLYDVWENRNELYLVMERVEGGELFEFIEKNGYLPEDETVWLLRQILAGLLHCHRLGIHHRDLKPENILLSQYDGDTQVKLVDFGMAALQPKGKLLTTPCGSIHYAAPEVFEKRYDGNKIDVWSLGVILYVMLLGTTPFQYDHSTMENDTGAWYRMIKTKRPVMPDHLTPDAADLISKMLVADPRRRISLEACWLHPLIQRYCREWDPHDLHVGSLERWIGPRPIIGSWNVKSIDDLDREILRSLKTLWHSEKEEVLLARLLSSEPNQEKFFYSALRRHQEEQLENYLGVQEGFAYSASDYHHIKAPDPSQLPPIPPSAYTRTKSSFSLQNPAVPSKNSLREPPASERSYDPYRASREPIISSKNNYSVTMVRGGSSKHSRQQSGGRSTKQGNSLRVEALRNERSRLSNASKSSVSLRKSTTHLRSIPSGRRSMSKSSMATSVKGSSVYASSPPVTMKPSAAHKRPVAFSHTRGASVASGRMNSKSSLGEYNPLHQKNHGPMPTLRSSPASQVQTVVKSRKERDQPASNAAAAVAATTEQLLGRPSLDIDTRKASSELEKFCEELFFRTSIASNSTRTSATASQSHEPFETPPSSVLNRGSGYAALRPSKPASSVPVKRLLSDAQRETPNTFIARELAETRRRLLDRYAGDDSVRNSTYDEVLAHLDQLLHQGNASGKRVTSAPDPMSQNFSGRLPSIMEERKSSDDDEPRPLPSRYRYNRATTDPQPATQITNAQLSDATNTIRLIDGSSPPRIAPLVIRKVGSTLSTQRQNLEVGQAETSLGSSSAQEKPDRQNSVSERMSNKTSSIGTDAPKRHSDIVEQGDAGKKGWLFGKKRAKPLNKWFEDLDDRTAPKHTTATYVHHQKTANQSDSTLSSPQSPVVANKRPGFLSFLKKRKPKTGGFVLGAEEDEQAGNEPGDMYSYGNQLSQGSTKDTTGASSQIVRQTDRKDLGVQQHWLARMLHIKPATKVICFDRGIGASRGEIVRLLRSWKMYGIRGVRFSREKNLIWGRLGVGNYLGIKEVSFAIQLFVVLKEDRRAKLSIARFTQTRGSASSFRKIVDYLETVLDGRNLLVKDAKARNEMAALLAG